ncbi:MAG: hypothetical protein GY869_31765 [Planctomycetes bacterium]|nr:hypothetical protein [Planctomycetota bacterium]
MTNLTGCGLLGGFYGVFIDPFIPRKPVPAEHDLSKKNVLVWVDYQAASDTNHMLRRELTDHLRQELIDNNAVASIVDYQRIARRRLLHPEIMQMTIQQLGQQFNTDQVLYLLVDNFELSHEAGPGFYKPTVTGYLKIIDVDSGKRLWPTNQTQHPFTCDTGFTEAQNDLQQQRMIRELCQKTARSLARFFYEHRSPREVDEKK